MHTDVAAAHRRAEDIFEHTLKAVPEGGWDEPSACSNWTIRDVVGHAVWGRELIRTCALGDEISDPTAAPGATHPADFLVEEPLTAFRSARGRCDAAVTEETLSRPALAFVRRTWPEATVGDFLANLVSDLIVHTWDIGNRIGARFAVDEQTLAVALAPTSDGVTRSAAFFADELTPPTDASAVDTWLAFLGRDPRVIQKGPSTRGSRA